MNPKLHNQNGASNAAFKDFYKKKYSSSYNWYDPNIPSKDKLFWQSKITIYKKLEKEKSKGWGKGTKTLKPLQSFKNNTLY